MSRNIFVSSKSKYGGKHDVKYFKKLKNFRVEFKVTSTEIFRQLKIGRDNFCMMIISLNAMQEKEESEFN